MPPPVEPSRSRIPTPVREFLRTESAGGVFLLAATAVALVWANSPWGDSYLDFWHRKLSVGRGPLGITEDLTRWINDGLMAIFFFVVALEIKRELVAGELRTAKAAALPVALAAGGMVVPALIYLALTAGSPAARGWAIPMATDIAFAVAVLGLAGGRIPSGSRLVLLSLAIVDDLGAILVIALFYSEGLEPLWLAAAAGVIGAILILRRVGAASPWIYILPGVVLWYCALRSGVHPTLAGVALGLLTPAGTFRGRRPLDELEHRVHPLASFVVLPLFALANAGVVLKGAALEQAAGSRLALAVVLGLFVGKPLGILLAGWVALRLKLAVLPDGMSIGDLLPIGMVAGIGFTVSLFIAGLSFSGDVLLQAKTSILAASVLSALTGLALVFLRSKRAG